MSELNDVGLSSPVDIRWVPVDDVTPNDYNPNEMDDRVFDELASDIDQEDLDQPVVVRPDPENEGKWIIIDGEHRWRGSKIKGKVTVPISVRHYSEEEAMIATVRRNLLHGELNTAKFNAMLIRLDENGITPEKARTLMAMDPRKFDKSWKGQTDKTVQRAEQLVKNAEVGVQLTAFVANLSQMVRDIVQENGDSIPKGYIGFMYSGKPCLMVSMDKKLHKIVSEYLFSADEDGKGQEQISADLQNAFKALLGGG